MKFCLKLYGIENINLEEYVLIVCLTDCLTSKIPDQLKNIDIYLYINFTDILHTRDLNTHKYSMSKTWKIIMQAIKTLTIKSSV